MNIIKEKLRGLVTTPLDINEHLYTLMGFADGCKHITEMGVRNVVSTWAFLAANPTKLVCIDIMDCPIQEAQTAADNAGIELEFIKTSTLDPTFNIEETDFLFIDTLHTFSQLSQELTKYSDFVRKYIAFHDTTSFGSTNEDGIQIVAQPQGLIPAINNFLASHPEWKLLYQYNHNNGVSIIQRIEQ
jgi:predicted O-methyltransferase YrrM